MLCLVTLDGNRLVGDLKDAIKAKKAPEFDSFSAVKLKLWNVKIPDDRDLLSNLTLQDQDEQQKRFRNADLTHLSRNIFRTARNQRYFE